MNEPTNESQPTPNQTQPAQTNQHKPALAGMCQVCGGECNLRNTLCDKCDAANEGMAPRLSVMDPGPARVSGQHRTLRWPSARPYQFGFALRRRSGCLSIDHLQEIDDAGCRVFGGGCMLRRPCHGPIAAIHPSVLKCLSICADCNRLSPIAGHWSDLA